jgi:hypothetical protein
MQDDKNVQNADWKPYAIAPRNGDPRTVWRYTNDDERDVFQVTFGPMPTNNGGYFNLDTILRLKGIGKHELTFFADEITPVTPRL